MKALLLLISILSAMYFFQPLWLVKIFSNIWSYSDQVDGVQVFTFDECGAPCSNATALIRQKNLAFELINVSTSAENAQRFRRLGVASTMPVVLVGSRRVVGYERNRLEEALAEVYGLSVLSPALRAVMADHFDTNGEPRVVMYGAAWCPYCKKARKYLQSSGIDFIEYDVERDSNAARRYQKIKSSGYPLIYVGTRRIEGWNQSALEQAL